jgi:hypothetical protein
MFRFLLAHISHWNCDLPVQVRWNQHTCSDLQHSDPGKIGKAFVPTASDGKPVRLGIRFWTAVSGLLFFLVSAWTQAVPAGPLPTTGFFDPGPDTSQQRLLELEAWMARGGHLTVIQELETVRAAYPKAYASNVLLAKAYMALRQFEKAETVLRQIVPIKVKKGDPYLRFHLAFAQYRQGKAAEASSNLALFESGRPPYQQGIWAEMKQMKASLNRKDTLATTPDRYWMDTTFRFPNSAYADFSPLPLGDSAFLFSALRQDSLVEYTPGQPNFHTIQLFKYTVRPDGRFDEIEVVKGLNIPGYHAGNGRFSADGKRFFFTRCTDGSKGKPACSIYEAEVRADGSFHKIRKLSDRINRRKYSASQPYFATFSVNGVEQDVLYFVSNRRGGFGKNDIWFSSYNRKRKRFSSPMNAGFAINSAGDDESPYVDMRGNRFYFSSDGFPGFGGKDVYSAALNGIYLMRRQLLPQPINSIADDHYFTLSSDGQTGYLSSNRKGANELDKTYCCEDVFRFEKGMPPMVRPVKPVVLADTVRPVPVVVPPPVLASADTVVRVPLSKVEEVPLKNPISPRSSTQSDDPSQFLKKTDLQQQRVYFAKNSSVLTAKSKQRLVSVLKTLRKDKPLKVYVQGFADVRGKVALNQKLARSRARSAALFLKRNGLKIPLEVGAKDLSKALQTNDLDMLSLDRFVEISWAKPVPPEKLQ